MKDKVEFNHYRIFLPNLPQSLDGIRFCHLSDLHSAKLADNAALIADGIRRENPDCILATGDMADCAKDRGGSYFFSIADALHDFPLLCSPGNHERRIGSGSIPQRFAQECAARNIPYLDNQSVTMPLRGTDVTFYGYLQEFTCFDACHERGSRLRQDVTAADLSLALGDCRQQGLTVLLAHDPMMFPAYAQWGASLVCSGHLHGGLVRLPLLGGLLSPARTFFPRYDAGIFRKNNSTLFVSRGLSVSELPRIFNRPEVAFLTLLRGTPKKRLFRR